MLPSLWVWHVSLTKPIKLDIQSIFPSRNGQPIFQVYPEAIPRQPCPYQGLRWLAITMQSIITSIDFCALNTKYSSMELTSLFFYFHSILGATCHSGKKYMGKKWATCSQVWITAGRKIWNIQHCQNADRRASDWLELFYFLVFRS